MLESIKRTYHLLRPYLQKKTFRQMVFMILSRSFLMFGIGMASTPVLLNIFAKALQEQNYLLFTAILFTWIVYAIWLIWGDMEYLIAYNRTFFENEVHMHKDYIDKILNVPYESIVKKYEIGNLLTLLDDGTDEVMMRFQDFTAIILKGLALLIVLIWTGIISHWVIPLLMMMFVFISWSIVLHLNKYIGKLEEMQFVHTSNLRELQRIFFENSEDYISSGLNGYWMEVIQNSGSLKYDTEKKINIAQQWVNGIQLLLDILVYIAIVVYALISLSDIISIVTLPLLFNTIEDISKDLLQSISRIQTKCYAVDQFNHIDNDSILKENINIESEGNGKISLVLDGVCFTANDQTIIDNATLQIEDNEKIIIVGENGSGKSTLLRLIIGLLEPKTGQGLINGLSTYTMDYKSRGRLFTYSPSKSMLFPATLYDNLILSSEKTVDNTNLYNLLDDFGLRDVVNSTHPLDGILKESGKELSTGQGQRICLIRTLIAPGRLIVLDEPTAHVDSQIANKIWEHIMNTPKTVIAAVHDFADIGIKYNPRVIWVDRGRIIADGSYNTLVKESPKFAEWSKIKSTD